MINQYLTMNSGCEVVVLEGATVMVGVGVTVMMGVGVTDMMGVGVTDMMGVGVTVMVGVGVTVMMGVGVSFSRHGHLQYRFKKYTLKRRLIWGKCIKDKCCKIQGNNYQSKGHLI